jgi:SH3 domain-containing YSC84-like protein 1
MQSTATAALIRIRRTVFGQTMSRCHNGITALFTVMLLVAGATNGSLAASSEKAQEVVDESRIALKSLTNNGSHPTVSALMREARGVLIFPKILKGGIGLGGEGGSGVLLSRSADGVWSYPAFYGIRSVSIGLQLGIQETRMVILIMSDQALEKLMDGDTRFGGDLSAVAINDGLDEELSTITARNDIYYYAETGKGLFAGISLEGSNIRWQNKTSRNYYGRDVAPTDILIDRTVSNPAADGLRRALESGGASGTASF